MIDVALEHDKPVRIGVNWGSLDQDLLARMMDENAEIGEAGRCSGDSHSSHRCQRVAIPPRWQKSYGMAHNKIILSAKVSEVPDLISVYRRLAKSCDYALHLGLTEAGMSTKGIVSSTAA